MKTRLMPLAGTLVALAACTYDGSVGSMRTPSPPAPGHFSPRWVMSIGGLEQERGYSVAVAGNGDVILAGTAFGTPDFTASAAQLPAAPRTGSPPDEDTGYVAVRSGVDGSHLWGATLSGVQRPGALDVAGDADGTVYVAGVRVTGEEEEGAPFLAAYAADGALRWERSLDAASRASLLRVAITDDGPIVSGTFSGTAGFGASTVTATGTHDGLVIAYDINGAERWHVVSGDPSDDTLYNLVALDDGGVALLGTQNSSTTLSRYDAMGSLVWSQVVAPLGAYSGVLDISRHGDDGLVLAGQESGVGPAAGLSVRVLDLDGALVDVGEVARSGYTATVLDNGMVVASGQGQAMNTASLTAFDAHGVLGDGVIAAVNPNPPHLISGGAMIRDLATDGAQVVAAGDFDWGIDIGGEAWWPHGSGPAAAPDTSVTGGRDALVVMFDWITD